MLSKDSLFQLIVRDTATLPGVQEQFAEIVRDRFIYLDNVYTSRFKLAVQERLPTRLIFPLGNTLVSARQILQSYPQEVSLISPKDLEDLQVGNDENFQREQRNEEQDIYLNIIVATQSYLLASSYFYDNQIISSGLTVTKEGIKFSPNVDKNMGIDIFNQIRCTLYVPYVQFVNNLEESKIKVYQSTRSEDRPRYSMINEMISDNKKLPSMITFVVWAGNLYNKERSLSEAPSTDFILVEYDLELNILDIPLTLKSSSSDEGRKEIVSRVQEALPIDFGPAMAGKIGGNCKFTSNFEINEPFLLELILNDIAANNFFYLEENKEPFYLKPNSYFYYRQMYSDLNARDQKLSKISYNRADVTFTVEIGEGTLFVNILSANTRAFADEFLEIWRMVLLTLARPDVLNAYFTRYGLDNIRNFQMLATKPISAKDDITKSRSYYEKEASKKFVFAKNPTTCPSHKPKVIENANEYAIVDGQRPIMTLPIVDGSTLSYYCETSERPWPGLKFTNEMYQPCCYARDNMGDPTSNYQYWLTGRDPKTKKGGRSTHINTLKIIEALGNTGELPSNLNSILSQGANNFKRMGVTKNSGINSLIQAVQYALAYTSNYSFLEENDLFRLRTYIGQTIPLEVVKQELYEYSLENIQKMINNPYLYFDPLLFYRLLEEFFQVNLFFFSPEGFSKKQVPGDLVFPNYHLVPFRRVDYSRTILIYINPGTAYGSANTPICELIISQVDGRMISVFDDTSSGIRQICLSLYQSKMKIDSWEYLNNTLLSSKNLEIQFNMIDGLRQLSTDIIPRSQYIDKYGKTRSITFEYHNERFTFLTSPMAPYRLPFSEEVSYLDVNSVFLTKIGGFTAVTKSTENLADGLWLNWGTDRLYLPMKSFNLEGNDRFKALPIEESHPLSKKTLVGSLVHRNTVLRKIANVLSELLIYFYQLYRLENSFFNSDLDFIEKYFYLENNPPKKDSVEIYDISRLSRKLYSTTSLEEALAYYRTVLPSFVREKLYFYNANFYRNCSYLISNYLKNVSSSEIPLYISSARWYNSVYDFNSFANTLVFLSNEDYFKWLIGAVDGGSALLKVVSQISLDHRNLKKPYLLSREGRYYLVQNVNLKGWNGYITALRIADYWYRYTVNPGLLIELPKLEEKLPQHRVLTVNEKGELVTYSEYSGNSSKTLLEVLLYPLGRSNLTESYFAALLPL